MRNALTNIGIVTALIVVALALIGAKHVAAGTVAAVDNFDIVKIWKSWNYVLTFVQVLFICIFIYWMSGKKFVIVEKEKEPEKEYDILEDDTDDWSIIRKRKESELPSLPEVMQDLRGLTKEKRSSEYWKQKAKTAKVKRFQDARLFCLSEKSKSEDREEKERKEKLKAQNNPSPTVVMRVK